MAPRSDSHLVPRQNRLDFFGGCLATGRQAEFCIAGVRSELPGNWLLRAGFDRLPTWGWKLQPSEFDAVLCFWNSFGYFEKPFQGGGSMGVQSDVPGVEGGGCSWTPRSDRDPHPGKSGERIRPVCWAEVLPTVQPRRSERWSNPKTHEAAHWAHLPNKRPSWVALRSGLPCHQDAAPLLGLTLEGRSKDFPTTGRRGSQTPPCGR